MLSVIAFFLLFFSTTTAQCPINSRQSPGHINCISCEVGEVSQGDFCTRCPAGTRAGRGVCVSCDVGSFSLRASDVCTPCPVGTVAPTTGMSSCESCPIGRVPFGASECRPCPLGYEAANDSSSCLPCPSGSARQQFDYECVLCPPGSYAPTQGAVECALCGTGLFAATPGSVTCEACPVGFISGVNAGVNNGSDACIQCPPGTTTSGHGGECVGLVDQSDQYRLSEGATLAYSYAMGSVFFFLGALGLLGQRWYDRLQKRETLLV